MATNKGKDNDRMRGILKHDENRQNVKKSRRTTPHDQAPIKITERPIPPRDKIQFDEINIGETLHPLNKTYGHTKIDEPKTPFERNSDTDELIDPTALMNKLANLNIGRGKSEMMPDMDEDEDHIIPETSGFNDARKEHYKEFQAVKEARRLIEQEFPKMNENDESTLTSKDGTRNNSIDKK